MCILRFVPTLVIALLACSATVAHQTTRAEFPSDDYIRNALTQVDRAILMFDASIAADEKLGGEDARTSRELSADIKRAVAALRRDPNEFHSIGGYALINDMHDIVRTQLSCSNVALGKAVATEAASTSRATNIHVSASCMDGAVLAQTVTENLQNLFARSVAAKDNLLHQSMNIADRCESLLKKNGAKR
jgi:hypothetical protein